MLKHNLPETSSPLSTTRAEATASENTLAHAETVTSNVIEQSVSDYLDRIMSSLTGTLSEEEIAERRAEMHSHILTMVDARIELGDTLEDALKETFAQFGQPRRLQTEWTEASESVESFKTSFVKNLKYFGIQNTLIQLALSFPMVVSIIQNRLVDYGNGIMTWTPWFRYIAVVFVFVFLSLLSPLFVGFRRGYRGYDRKRGTLSWFGSVVSLLTSQAIVGATLALLVSPIDEMQSRMTNYQGSSQIIFRICLTTTIFSVLGVSAGCIARIIKRRRKIVA